MKSLLQVPFVFCVGLTIAQPNISKLDMDRFYNWFESYAQSDHFYEPGSVLITFNPSTRIFEGPCHSANQVAVLNPGHQVINRTDIGLVQPSAELRGYEEKWYRVETTDKGNTVSGYIWGGDLAKGWYEVDLDSDHQSEWLLLGLSERPREGLSEFFADLKIVQAGKVLNQYTIPGLCLFDPCDSDVLLRTVESDRFQNSVVIEASVMSIGCAGGIQRAFLIFNESRFHHIYQAEFTTQTPIHYSAFTVTDLPGQTCYLEGIGKDFDPIWACESIKQEPIERKRSSELVAKDRAR